MGLSRSFLLAGAQNTMVSLWYVPDLATSALMIDFYQQLQDFDKPQALRRAMLNTMQTYPSPPRLGGIYVGWAVISDRASNLQFGNNQSPKNEVQLKPTTRIELVTSPLPRVCSTTEPRGHIRFTIIYH